MNPSINILKLGLTTVGHTGTYATADLPSWAIGLNLSSNGESGRISASLDRGVSKDVTSVYLPFWQIFTQDPVIAVTHL